MNGVYKHVVLVSSTSFWTCSSSHFW